MDSYHDTQSPRSLAVSKSQCLDTKMPLKDIQQILPAHSPTAPKKSNNRQSSNVTDISNNNSDDHTAVLHETLANEIQISYDDFRDKAMNIYEESVEYIRLRGVSLLDKCHFGIFMDFCEQITEIIPHMYTNSNANRSDLLVTEDMDDFDF